MDKTIQMEKHIIEAWGLWWVEWQKQVKDRIKKQVMSPQAFVNEHLVSSEGKSFVRDTTTSLVLPPK
jgi:hypothetical protein